MVFVNVGGKWHGVSITTVEKSGHHGCHRPIDVEVRTTWVGVYVSMGDTYMVFVIVHMAGRRCGSCRQGWALWHRHTEPGDVEVGASWWGVGAADVALLYLPIRISG